MKKFFGVVLAATVVFGGGAVGAGIPQPLEDPTLTLEPSSGPAGTMFSVSGTSCTPSEGVETSVEVTAPDTVEGAAITTPDETGAWSVDLTVPDDALAGDSIAVEATCSETHVQDLSYQGFRAPSGGTDTRNYIDAQFTVTASPTTAGPTTTEGTTTTIADGAVDEAEAAAPTIARPTFTG